MASDISSTDNSSPSLFPSFSRFVEEAQCGKLGFTIVTVNMVVAAVFAGNLALGGALVGAVSLGAAVVALPSIALFGPSNYFYYLPQPLRMGLGFALAYATVKVDEKKGVWSGGFADWAHFDDHRLAKGLETFFQDTKTKTVMDCGCGTGFYVKQLTAAGLGGVYGCDGNPDTTQLGGDHCIVADLTKPSFLENTSFNNEKFDCVMSLEVAEHIPKDNQEIFLENLVDITKPKGLLILSWAKKGQGGLGHVNEQNQDYVLAAMQEKGCSIDWKETKKLRLQTSPNAFWFRETIYVFRTPDGLQKA